MCIFHKWTKWEYYLKKVKFISPPAMLPTSIGEFYHRTYIGKKKYTKRECIKCGKIEDVGV